MTIKNIKELKENVNKITFYVDSSKLYFKEFEKILKEDYLDDSDKISAITLQYNNFVKSLTGKV